MHCVRKPRDLMRASKKSSESCGRRDGTEPYKVLVTGFATGRACEARYGDAVTTPAVGCLSAPPRPSPLIPAGTCWSLRGAAGAAGGFQRLQAPPDAGSRVAGRPVEFTFQLKPVTWISQ